MLKIFHQIKQKKKTLFLKEIIIIFCVWRKSEESIWNIRFYKNGEIKLN
jgi:hypothetical protein